MTHYEFPLRRLFDWALALLLAVTTYLAAYSYVEFLSFLGPVQTALRAFNGASTLQDYWFPDIRSQWGAAIVLSSVLYRSDFGGAAQLAVTVVLVIGLLIAAEQRAWRDRVYLGRRDSCVPPAREILAGDRA
ncbi:MAG: hypothetical protein MO846_07855 [Candidatus Devosia symbiotica]|nr:hypothetical protein [Candidatus Devosia symbiotica]